MKNTKNEILVEVHPLLELISRKLFGIEHVPKKEQRRMVNRACKEAVAWHESQILNEYQLASLITKAKKSKGDYDYTGPYDSKDLKLAQLIVRFRKEL